MILYNYILLIVLLFVLLKLKEGIRWFCVVNWYCKNSYELFNGMIFVVDLYIVRCKKIV